MGIVFRSRKPCLKEAVKIGQSTGTMAYLQSHAVDEEKQPTVFVFLQGEVVSPVHDIAEAELQDRDRLSSTDE